VKHACTATTLLTAPYWLYAHIYAPDLHQTIQETSNVGVFITETQFIYCAARARSLHVF